MATPRLILVGGFLGAGKTTLLAEAAKALASQGHRVGLITNDQAPELVDTAILSRVDSGVEEVSGSCFCCNFPGLLNAIENLRRDSTADVVIAEPVGSCTDLSATIVQPIKDMHRADIDVAPLSVLTDPDRLDDILNGGFAGLHPSAAYIFRKQMEEADILVISKSDLLAEDRLEELRFRASRQLPLTTVICVSARTGDGLESWLDAVMKHKDSGQRLPEVDYDIYAEGEAVLGWLNATFELQSQKPQWVWVAEHLLRDLSDQFESDDAAVGHVKLILESGEHSVAGNLTGGRDTLSVRGSEWDGHKAKLILNARVQMPPEALEQVVRQALQKLSDEGVQITPNAWRCLSPGRPTPTHRYDRLVSIG